MYVTSPGIGEAYAAGLRAISESGAAVPSVLDPLSKASNFGAGNRPYAELIAYTSEVLDPRECIADSDTFRLNLPYSLGLLAWSLDGRDDVETLAYYRPGASEYSDDEHTLSGAFGRRLVAGPHGDQVDAIVRRIEADPSHRRTFAMVLDPSDNFSSSREYPCAVGVQLFLRNGRLSWLTVMRAQQAVTVLPYDAFLFMAMQQFVAAAMDVELGSYIHQSGTFHYYDNEAPAVERLLSEPVRSCRLPELPHGRDAIASLTDEFVDLESTLRAHAMAGDVEGVNALAETEQKEPFLDLAQACLGTLGYQRLGVDKVIAPKQEHPRDLVAMIGRR